jgi:hypothetical protein
MLPALPFPDRNDHGFHQHSVESKVHHRRILRTPEVIVGYIVSDLRRQYRAGNQHVKTKFGFPLAQLGSMTFTSSEHDGDTTEQQRARKQSQLDATFQPLFESVLNYSTLTGKVTIEVVGDDNCIITAKYEIKAPKVT